MASAKFQGNSFKIDVEITENHAVLVDIFNLAGSIKLNFLLQCVIFALHHLRYHQSDAK